MFLCTEGLTPELVIHLQHYISNNTHINTEFTAFVNKQFYVAVHIGLRTKDALQFCFTFSLFVL